MALALGLALVGGCTGAEERSEPAKPRAVRAALETRLLDRKLSYRWVVCVPTNAWFAGSPIFRCNVNFGEPHIVRYCATLNDGHLTTNREQPAMRCGRDTAS